MSDTPESANGSPPEIRPSTPEEVRRGKTQLIVVAHEGQVIIRYPQPMAFVAMEPENARNIAEAIAGAAFEARYGEKPPPAASEIARRAKADFLERARTKMINRLAIVLNSETMMALAPKDRAVRLVDIIMNEIA